MTIARNLSIFAQGTFASGGVSIGNTTDPGATNLSVTGKLVIGTTTPRFNLSIGSTSASASSTPNTIDLGGTYSSTAGANGKLRVWYDGTNYMGFGVSASQLDYIATGSYSHVFYVSSAEVARIDTSGNLLVGNTSAPSGVTNGSMLSKNQGVTNYSNNYAASTTYTATINFPVNKYNGAAGYVFYDLTIGYALYPANPQTTYYQIIGVKLVVDSYYAGNQSYWASYLNAGIPYIVINSITPNVASGNVAINFTTSAAFGSGGGGATVNFNVACIGGSRGY